jgi:hypothetical protein
MPPCPVCQGEDVAPFAVEASCAGIVVSVRCLRCGHEWGIPDPGAPPPDDAPTENTSDS